MAEPMMLAENVRTMLAESLERLRKASSDYFDLLGKSLASAQLPGGDHARQFCELTQRNLTATYDACDKLIKAKDVQDSVTIQSEFFKDQMRAVADQARGLGESAMKSMTEAFTPKR